MKLRSLIPCITIALILAGGISACKDDPTAPKPGGKDTCDTCGIDTNDTVVVVDPNDTTSHDFVWTEYSLSGEASVGGCWVFNDTTIWVMADKFYTLQSGTWKHKSLKNQKGWDLNSGLSGANLFCFDPNDAWINSGGIQWHYRDGIAIEYRNYQDGTGLLHYPEDGSIRAMWGTSSNDMFFVGDKGTIVHFDGTNWMKFPKVTETNLQSVWGSSSSNVWACGYDNSTGQTTLLHYDGASWSIDPLTLEPRIMTGPYMGIWAGDSAGVPVATVVGTLVFRKTDNGPWRRDSGRVPNWDVDSYIGMGVRGNNPNDLLLAGAGGLIIHWNGSTYKRYDQFFEPNNPVYFTGAASIKGNTAVVAGSKNGSWIAIGRRAK